MSNLRGYKSSDLGPVAVDSDSVFDSTRYTSSCHGLVVYRD